MIALYNLNNGIKYERIRDLEVQCWEPQGVGAAQFDSEKFAELIVRECADLFVNQKYMVLNPTEPFAKERVRALQEHDKDTVRKIKGHFGVK